MPSVLPRNLTSSTASFSFNALICGSISSAVVSFRPLPSRENSLSVDIVIVTKERNSQDVSRAIVSGGRTEVWRELAVWGECFGVSWWGICTGRSGLPSLQESGPGARQAGKPRRRRSKCWDDIAKSSRALPRRFLSSAPRHHHHNTQWHQVGRRCRKMTAATRMADTEQHHRPPPTWAQTLRTPPRRRRSTRYAVEVSGGKNTANTSSLAACAPIKKQSATNACCSRHRTTPRRSAPTLSPSTRHAWLATGSRSRTIIANVS